MVFPSVCGVGVLGWCYRFMGTVVGPFNLKSSLFSHSHGFMVKLILEWFTEGSQWLNFCGFFSFPPVVVVGNGWLQVAIRTTRCGFFFVGYII